MTQPARLPRAVLFDWDNTLVDSWGIIEASVNVTLEAMGHPTWTSEEIRVRVRHSLRNAFPPLFGDRWEEARTIYYDHFSAHHIEQLRALPGADRLIKTLHGMGIYLAVVSNKTGRFLRQEAEALGWSPYFGSLVGSADAPADKPAVAPVTMALAPAGGAVGDVWFVGDADIDMECAHASGCLPVLVSDNGEGDFSRFPPAVRVDSCLALCDLVRRLGGALSVTNSPERALTA
ncbi:MAG: HAD family hydrolase [Rhodospirillaceae bacterium]